MLDKMKCSSSFDTTVSTATGLYYFSKRMILLQQILLHAFITELLQQLRLNALLTTVLL